MSPPLYYDPDTLINNQRQVKSWGRVELHFFDGQDGLSIKVLCSDLHDADKFTLDMSVPLNDEQIAKANEELDKLRAKIEDVRPASFSLVRLSRPSWRICL